MEAGGVEPHARIENTQVIEKSRRTSRQSRTKSSSAVHGMYTKFELRAHELVGDQKKQTLQVEYRFGSSLKRSSPYAALERTGVLQPDNAGQALAGLGS